MVTNILMSTYDLDFVHFSIEGRPHRAKFDTNLKVIYATCNEKVDHELNAWLVENKQLVTSQIEKNKIRRGL